MRLAAVATLLLLACRTPDTTGPSVVTFSPTAGATNVARNASVRVVFSEAMARAAAESALTVVPAVPGNFEWPDDGTMVFTPIQPLDSFAAYNVTVGTGACDIAGNALVADRTWSFTTGATARSATFVMFGRSVLEGWFYHWGWDGQELSAVTRSRFDLYHRYLTGPEDNGANTIADFRQQVNALDVTDNPAVFFKLCFIDFAGGDSAEAQANLARNERLVDSLYAIVSGRGLRVIVGNALPVTESEHDAWRYWNHARYNAYINQLAQAHPDSVFVLDLYGIFTDPATGCIRHEYRTGVDDAHPNAAGYSALDPALDELLEQHF